MEALVLGIGNVLWADEGFGVRAVEALVRDWELPPGVEAMDGGTQGLYLLNPVMDARRLIVFDAVDFGLAPGTLKSFRDDEVPAWGATKMSLHQTHFSELLALAQLQGRAPRSLLLVGVQPVELSDFGGSLRAEVRAQLAPAVELAVRQLRDWGLAPAPRVAPAADACVNAAALSIDAYERGRPATTTACRIGDARFLNRRAAAAGTGELEAG